MYQQLKLYELLGNEVKRSEQLIKKMKSRLCKLPEGSLFLKNGYCHRLYYEKGNKRQVKIARGPEENELLINELQERQFILRALPTLEKKFRACEDAVNKFCIYDPQAIKCEMPEAYDEFDWQEVALKGDVDPDAWRAESYERSTNYPEKLIYKSEGGILTRSKSEADIATKLEQSDLAFRYEETLRMGGRLVSPDFSVMHHGERRVKYWEHLGMMDNPVRAIDKLCFYAEHGINLGENLIVTWESRARPLLFEHINSCIKRHFT